MNRKQDVSVLQFASQELEHYLSILSVQAQIKLGLLEEFGLAAEIKDPYLDDVIAICVKERTGYIAGSNYRSVLIGVYRLLQEWGIRWNRPGKNGTYYPKTPTVRDVELFEKADSRHRTMCIEGAVSLENVLDMIEWLPKVGMNGYYIQFDDAFIFFDRWYSHRESPVKESEPFSYEKARECVAIATQEVKRRGLLLHRMGHGWTSDPFGIENHGWDPVDPATIPQEYLDLCAELNGERKLFRDRPIFTQLCLSKPVVRKTIVNGVLEYLRKNPETDVLHFWLADYFNNTCECADCTAMRFSEFHTMMLNDITDALVEQGLSTQIVFNNSYNMGWPPERETVRNQEHAVLMFAPITRTFAETFPEGFTQKEIAPYKPNNFPLPRSPEENLPYLYQWEQVFSGDVLDYDYHLMWDHILDAGGEGIAKVLYQDIKNFPALGIGSFISCQLQRNAFPTSIAMTVMARTLWDRSTDFEEVRRDLYASTFGNNAVDALCDYFQSLSRGFSIGAMRSQVPVKREDFIRDLSQTLEDMDAFVSVIAENSQIEDPCHRESWELLALHREIYSLLGKAILAYLNGDPEKYEQLRQQSVQLAWENEDTLQPVLDCMFYGRMTRDNINLDGPAAFVAV